MVRLPVDREVFYRKKIMQPLNIETIARVVMETLRERFARLQNRRRKASVEELRAIAKRAAAHVSCPYADHADFLYDENGLPK
jgi:antitoxin VapB